jgi:DNA-binding NarL/FixJ family response regulator
MDYRLADGERNGAEGTRRLRELDPTLNVVMLTATTDDRVLSEALAAGCCGFVTKGASVDQLLWAVRSAANGDGAFPADVLRRLAGLGTPERGVGSDLTARELEVLRALGQGQGTQTMSRSLDLSEHTVRNYVRNILNKLGAHTKLEAVLIAARAGLIEVRSQ